MGPEGDERQSTLAEIYSTKQAKNKPQECLLLVLGSKELEYNCVLFGVAAISAHCLLC